MPVPLWNQIQEIRARDERRSKAPSAEMTDLLLLAKVSEEANETVEKYRRMQGWGTDGEVTMTLPEVLDEMCATIMAAMVTLSRLSPDAPSHWNEYLNYGYTRAKRERTEAGAPLPS